jgi:hypothetical protein
MEESNFHAELQQALSKKQEWYNTECLQELLSQYRLMHSCVKNLYECFVKKSLIVPDPYRLDKKISSIVVPESNPFAESDIPNVFGERFSNYETMLDYICTYFRFSTENFTLQNIKKLLDFNKVFEWDDLSMNNVKMNTRALAITISHAKNGAPSVVQSMINDSVSKCCQAVKTIGKMLNELGVFQRELYKGGIRKDLFEHPDFDKAKAAESPESELAEIKRLYSKITGKKNFYNDLVNEIIEEDHGPNKEAKQAAVFEHLSIKNPVKEENKKKSGPDTKEMLMQTVLAIGACAPTLIQLHAKLNENFDILFTRKATFWNKLMALIIKAFNLKEPERSCQLPVKDAKTGAERIQKINVTEFLTDLGKKERVYNGIATKGNEYQRIDSANEDAVLGFVNKQISELQSEFVIINSLDAFFKNEVASENKARVKGMQIELSALRNSIINANKKRSEYASYKEETEQMRKLGITND